MPRTSKTKSDKSEGVNTERTRVRKTVPAEAKRCFEDAVREEYGCVNGKAGHVLEDQLRALFGDSLPSKIATEVDELLESLGLPSRDPVTEQDSPGGETALIQYRVRSDLLDRVNAAASNDSTRGPGDFLAAVMWHYAHQGGILGQVYESLQTARDYVKSNLSSDDNADEIDQIISDLEDKSGDLLSFSIDDFLDSTALVCGSRSDHMVETKLPAVLDRLDMTWHPNNPDLFIDPGALGSVDIPAVRDPRPLPSNRVDKSDRVFAVKILGYERAISGRGVAKLTTADITGGVESIANVNVNDIMQAVADEPGYTFEEEDRSHGGKVLKVSAKAVEDDDVRRVVDEAETGADADAGDEPQDDGDDEKSAADRAVETLDPDNLEDKSLKVQRQIVASSIGSAYDNEIGVENVPNDEIDAVCDRLGLTDANDGSEDETDDDVEAEVDAEFDVLEESSLVEGSDDADPIPDTTEDDADQDENEPETAIEDTRWFAKTIESITDRDLVALWDTMDEGYIRDSIATEIANVRSGTTAESVDPEAIDAVAGEIGLELEEQAGADTNTAANSGKRVATDGGVVSGE